MGGRSRTDGQRSRVGSGGVCWPGRLASILLAGGPLGALPSGAWAQAAGDSVGSLFSGGNLRGALEGILPNRPRVNTGLAWNTQASLAASLGWTDNPGGQNTLGSRSNSPSMTGYVQPSFSLSGDAARLSAQLAYSPSYVFYPSETSQNRLSHYLNAGATATLVPEHVFVDVRAYATAQPSYGGSTTGVSTPVPAALTSGANTQVAGASISPSYTTRFGGWGRLQAGLSLSHIFEGNQSNRPVQVQNTGLPGFGTTGSLTTSTEY